MINSRQQVEASYFEPLVSKQVNQLATFLESILGRPLMLDRLKMPSFLSGVE